MNYVKSYANFLGKFLNLKKPLRAVFDCSNGTTGQIIRELGDSVIGKLEIILINDNPDGNFPAHGPNPMLEGAMDDLSKAVLKYKADLGVIFDADGDRVFFVDDLGRPVISDMPIILLSGNFRGSVVLSINVGMLAREMLKNSKKKIIDSRVGHYFLKKEIKAKKAEFGAERSGHYYFKKFFSADSGIFAALQFINSVSSLKEKLSFWVDKLPKYCRSGEINFGIKDKEKAMKRVENYYSKKSVKISHLDGLTVESAGWRLNLRPSNTEDLLRLNLESKDKKVFDNELSNLKKLLS